MVAECVTGKKVLIKGNYAIAQAAVLAGCQCYLVIRLLHRVKSENL